MATSSKDIETLWQRYSEEGSKKGISLKRMEYHIMCLRNGISASISSMSCDDDLIDKEREQYRKQISELIGAVETLLDANRSIGEQLNDATTKLDEANSAIGALQDYVATLEGKIKKLEGKDASNNRIRFAKRGDKVDNPEPDKGKIKEQRESDST